MKISLHQLYLHIGYALLFLILLYTNLQAQKVTQEETTQAIKYKEIYKDEKGIILHSDITFEFKFDKENKPYIQETVKHKIQSLRINDNLNMAVFYDDYSKLEQVSCKTTTNKSAKGFTTVCGSHEIDGIFHSDAKFCNYIINFLSIGETKTLNYSKKYLDLKYFTSVYFHEQYPVLEKKVTFIIPSSLNIDVKQFNFKNFNIIRKEEKDGLGNNIITYTTSELAPTKPEQNGRSYGFTYPHLLVLSKSYQLANQKVQILETLNDQYKWYSSLVKGVQNNQDDLKPVVDELIKGKSEEIDKVKAIFYWVQDNIRYIAFEAGMAGYIPENAHNVFQKKFGDCKGMANLTKAMLKLAGFDARLTWIGTNDIPYTYETPCLAVDNHMICTLILNNKKYYLDATEKYISFDDLAERIQGREALIENGETYYHEKLPVKSNERNKTTLKQTFNIEGENLVGEGQISFKGDKKVMMLNYFHNVRSEKKDEVVKASIFGSNKNVIVNNYEISDINNREADLAIKFKASITSQISAFDKDLYIPANPFFLQLNLNAKNDRLSDLHLGHKMYDVYEIKIKIPKGYKIKTLPPNLSEVHPSYTFKIQHAVSGGFLVTTTDISIKNDYIPKENFQEWNETLEKFNKLNNEQIVLTKI